LKNRFKQNDVAMSLIVSRLAMVVEGVVSVPGTPAGRTKVPLFHGWDEQHVIKGAFKSSLTFKTEKQHIIHQWKVWQHQQVCDVSCCSDLQATL